MRIHPRISLRKNKMGEHFKNINRIYMIVLMIMIPLSIVTLTLPSITLEDATEYYFFLANKYKDTYQYTGKRLEIKTEPRGYNERPLYIFRNRLLFLYYGYAVRLKEIFSPQFKLSFDIYPEQFFKKMYPLDGKIISFAIDLLRSQKGVYALEYKLDLSDHNRCTAVFTLKGVDEKIIDITDKNLEKDIFIPYIHKMHLEIVSHKNDIVLYINGRLISRGMIEGGARTGVFNFNKFPGSQFQMDNLEITDFSAEKEIIKDNFDKYVNFFDIKEWLFPHARVFFIIMLFALAGLGYAFDRCLILLSGLLGSEMLWLQFAVPQALFLFTFNRFCSLSIQPGLYAICSIVVAKVIYSGVNFLKMNSRAE
ncbi:MAG: hypothetical protein PHY56_04505 [Candidatus Omnitrophica bacterium]|nr:hypothetical protein [Candidatus Omnitrophota bacterium]